MLCNEFTHRTLPEELLVANLLVTRICGDSRECRRRLAHACTSDSPRDVHRTDEQKGRKQIWRTGKMPLTIRADEAREHRCEQDWSDHKGDTAQTAERALKLSLLGRTHTPRHHALHRRPRESPQRIDRKSRPENRAGRRDSVKCEARDAEYEA